MNFPRLLLTLILILPIHATEVISIWPDKAPGETTANLGVKLPPKKADPSITRVKGITKPTLMAYLAPPEKSTGAAVVVLPGGGFKYVVPNLEGSETAKFLNDLGISVFVLSYRTKAGGNSKNLWKRPLQDSQRAVRYLRTYWEKFAINPEKIGLLAFSAGGQVGAMHLGDIAPDYEAVDAVDQQDHRVNFAMLVYPWRTLDPKSGKLLPQIQISKSAPPTFIVHTDDDASTALGAVAIYSALKRASVSAELHIYQNGGHGYGTRSRNNSAIGSWSARATDWLKIRKIGRD